MVIVSGQLRVRSGTRERYVAASLPSVVQARASAGCRDFVVAPDPIDQERVNVYEEWDSTEALMAFRGEGELDPELAAMIVDASVARHEVASSGPA